MIKNMLIENYQLKKSEHSKNHRFQQTRLKNFNSIEKEKSNNKNQATKTLELHYEGIES